jgi:DNA invertase Pin-like site-specific DNA recombinase
MLRFVAYYRVSTDRQGKSGLGLAAQESAVRDYVRQRQGQIVAELTEVESGALNDRRELARALALCRAHAATLAIAKLDRLARNVAFTATLLETGVDFVACDCPHANKLTIHVLSAMAEYEREQISARTKAALAQAKARGIKLGKPENLTMAARKRGRKAGWAAVTVMADRFAHDCHEIILSLQGAGFTTLRELADELNVRGIPTARGGRWHAATVARVMERAIA